MELLYERYEFNLTKASFVSKSACMIFSMTCLCISANYIYLTVIKLLQKTCGVNFAWGFFAFWVLMKLNTSWQSMVLLIAVLFLAEDKTGPTPVSHDFLTSQRHSQIDSNSSMERDVSFTFTNSVLNSKLSPIGTRKSHK